MNASTAENIAGQELHELLQEIYPNSQFFIQEKKGIEPYSLMVSYDKSGIDYSLEKDVNLPTKISGAFHVKNNGIAAVIRGFDEMGLQYGVYALLEKLGYSFQLSYDVKPNAIDEFNFDLWDLSDFPLKEKRLIFNWHNFLSGCTSWNLVEWKNWINQAVKLRFNWIMIHTYGNNPINTFEYNGAQKEIGFLSTTLKGRDWGTEHVNDVRRLVGGNVFNDYAFGTEAALVEDDNRAQSAKKLMQDVFNYADERGLKICFAFDIDTKSANPQNILNTLPETAKINTKTGFKIANPETQEGYAYYKAQLKSLTSTYPQIDDISIWTRKYNASPYWLTPIRSLTVDEFPKHWISEYNNIVNEHRSIKDDIFSPSSFVLGKVITGFQKAIEEERKEIEVSSGSWEFAFMPSSDVFYPKEVSLIPLDFKVVFDSIEKREQLGMIGSHREVTPIVWAHHDDHRYIGKPYRPFDDFDSKLNEANANGFGIIHWTTRPLDSYFKSLNRQVWKGTQNEPIQDLIKDYVSKTFNAEQEKIGSYFHKWINEAPMFGRETSDFFMDPGEFTIGEKPQNPNVFLETITKRLELIKSIDRSSLNSTALATLDYFEGMEIFFQKFIDQQTLLNSANLAWENQEFDKTKKLIDLTNPDEVIEAYVAFSQQGAMTKGEEAIIISLNLRWLPDFIDQKQLCRIEPIRYNFQPTSHDPLAQAPGKYTFFIDDSGQFWKGLGTMEIPGTNAIRRKEILADIGDSYLKINTKTVIPLETIRGNYLSAGSYKLRINFETDNLSQINFAIAQKQQLDIEVENINNKSAELRFQSTGEELILQVDAGLTELNINSLEIHPI